jgi:hypothetical protein
MVCKKIFFYSYLPFTKRFDYGNINVVFMVGTHETEILIFQVIYLNVYLDGHKLAPTDFGEFDEDSGIWKPKAYKGLSLVLMGFI